jgi:hypothetical protein
MRIDILKSKFTSYSTLASSLLLLFVGYSKSYAQFSFEKFIQTNLTGQMHEMLNKPQMVVL